MTFDVGLVSIVAIAYDGFEMLLVEFKWLILTEDHRFKDVSSRDLGILWRKESQQLDLDVVIQLGLTGSPLDFA